MDKFNELWLIENNLTDQSIEEWRNSLTNFIKKSHKKICVLPVKDAVWFSVVSDILFKYRFEVNNSFIIIYK